MKLPLAIFGAAAAAVAAMWRAFAAGAEAPSSGDDDGAIPPMSAALVRRYALVGATNGEIADRFLVDESTVTEQYRDVIRSSRALHLILIRHHQMEAAKKLNASILVWLGKNELGQSAKPEEPGEALPVEKDEAN